MERLTIPHYGGNGPYMKCSERMECDSNCGECCNLDKIVDRLAYYEDTEEQGRLVVLPCKVGSTVYVTDLTEGKVEECEVACFSAIDENGCGCIEYNAPKDYPQIVSVECGLDEIGKTVFLTREEAEQALKGGAVK